MIDDFKPVRQPAKANLRSSLDALPDTGKNTQATETFKTPEQAAATDTVYLPPREHAAEQTPPQSHEPASPKSRRWHRKFILHWPPHKKEWIAAACLVLLCTCGGIVALTRHAAPKPVVVSAQKAVKKPAVAAPTTVPSTLTGLPVSPAMNKLPVTGVMIENSVQARPQAGLGQAGVVFEAIAEGGITRFLALYQDTAPANVGPIRSARPYYEQWALGFDAGYAHVGGSPEALADIKAWGVRDLDQFYNSGSYHRISSRAAPHNVYTAIGTLQQLETAKGYTSSNFSGFVRKAESPAKQVTAKTIDMKLSGPTYDIHYDYNPATNSYLRSEGGAAHVDANTNAQISPKVVIGLVMNYSLEKDRYHSDYATLGDGMAYIFQDGTVTAGHWHKPDAKTQFTFTDDAGKTIKLNPGLTWLTAVSAPTKVTSAP